MSSNPPYRPVKDTGDFFSRLGHNFTPSALGNTAKGALDTARQVLNPANAPAIAANIGAVADGIDSHLMASRAQLMKTNPQFVRAREAAADATWRSIVGPYTSVDQNGQRHFDWQRAVATLADDPWHVASDVASLAPVVGGGLRVAGKAADLGSMALRGAPLAARTAPLASALNKTGSVLHTAGGVANTVGQYANPAVGATIKGAQLAAPYVAPVIKAGVKKAITGPLSVAAGAQSGVGRPLLRTAAGMAENPNGRAVYQSVINGDVTPAQTSARIQKAIQTAKAGDAATTVAGKKALTDPVDISPLIDGHNATVADVQRGTGASNPHVQTAKSWVQDRLDDLYTDPDPTATSIYNLDGLKQNAYDMAQNTNSGIAKRVYMDLYGNIDDLIKETNPEYAQIMESSKDGINASNDLQATIGTKSKSGVSGVMKALKGINTLDGSNLLDKISGVDPDIPYLLLGHAAQSWLPRSGLTRYVLGGEMGLTGLAGIAASALHNPLAAAVSVPLLAGEAASSSPRIVTGAADLAGQAVAGVKKAAKPLVDPANGGRLAAGAATVQQIQNQRERPLSADEEEGLTTLSGDPLKSPPTPSLAHDDDALPPEYRSDKTPQDAAHDDDALPPEYRSDNTAADSPPAPNATGGQIGRASGGRIDHGAEKILAQFASNGAAKNDQDASRNDRIDKEQKRGADQFHEKFAPGLLSSPLAFAVGNNSTNNHDGAAKKSGDPAYAERGINKPKSDHSHSGFSSKKGVDLRNLRLSAKDAIDLEERLIQRLMRKAHEAKSAEDKKTKSLLKEPDEAIIRALDVAQQAI